MIKQLAAGIGLTDAAFRVTITLFAAYGLSALYRLKFRQQTPSVQHAYFIITGLGLMIFNYGWDTIHSMIGIVVAYLICKFIGGTTLSVIIAFVFYMGYIFVGFFYTATNEYDLMWTMPQCVLALRLIALVMDLYDGRTIKPEKMDANTKETVLTECPSLTEIAAASYFYAGFLVGPQYALRRFRDFVDGRYEPPTVTEEEDWERVKTSVRRMLLGISYMIIYTLFSGFYTDEDFLTSEFKNEYFIKKILILIVWSRATILRYQAAWLVAESSCILSGLAYNGRDEDGVALWDAVRNIRMVKFEFGTNFHSLVESFNYNTNLWASKYVFKRLKFLGNRTVSHLLTLLFLALWHGFHSGYLICFAFEFACIMTERTATPYFYGNLQFQTLARSPEMLFPMFVIKKSIVFFGLGFGFLSFSLLTVERWIEGYKSLYFFGWVMFAVTLALDKVLKRKKLNFGI